MRQPISQDGKLIAFMGLPCAGKSSVAKALGSLCNLPVFLEPEEDQWTDAVRLRDMSGYLTTITWFRSVRVPKLYQADKNRKMGQSSIVDSYYDKLLAYYLGKPGIEWLMQPEDPYFQVMQDLAELDLQRLPDADCVVALEVNQADWQTLLAKRNRNFDRSANLADTHVTQAYFIDAAIAFAARTGATLIHHKQTVSSPETAAQAILAQLIQEKVVTGMTDMPATLNGSRAYMTPDPLLTVC